MATDALQIVLDLLSDNWNSLNTNSKTPKFEKITGDGTNGNLLRKVNFNINQDWILAQRPRIIKKNSGIGGANKHEETNLDLDIRVKGYDQEAHFLNVVEEVSRIFDDNQANPHASYQLLEFDGTDTDLSDKMNHIWRKVFPVKISRFNISR